MRNSFWQRVAFRLSRALVRWKLKDSLPLYVAGQKMISPVVDGAFCSLSEPFMQDALATILPVRQGTFIDVGVNLGQTLALVKTYEPTRTYVGFEPNPICVYYANRFIATNGLKDCTLVPAGLGAHSGLIVLNHYSASDVDPTASIVTDFRPGEQVFRKSIVPLCNFSQAAAMDGMSDVGLVKIDVEGAELEVLASLKQLLADQRPWVLTEILPPYRANNTPRVERQRQIEEILWDCQYAIYRLGKNPDNSLSGLEPLAEFGLYDKVSMSDFIFVPAEDKPTVEALFQGRGS